MEILGKYCVLGVKSVVSKGLKDHFRNAHEPSRPTLKAVPLMNQQIL